MILIEYFRDNEIMLSEKGRASFAKAIRDVFPNLYTDLIEDNKLISWIMIIQLKEEDALKILQLAAKYSKLWLFS